MWKYAAAAAGIVLIAELAGLGGVPEASVAFENGLFCVLLLAFVALGLNGLVRH